MEKQHGLVLFFVIVFLSLLTFAFAAHVISSNTVSVLEDVTRMYNITVNNTDAALAANLTEVNITLPSSFIFLAGTNGTTGGSHTFVNTSSVLSWRNSAGGLVLNLSLGYFVFNATASTPGTYNLVVITTNSTSSSNSNVSIIVNDTTAPSDVSFASPTNATLSNLSLTYIIYNITTTENGNVSTLMVRLYNSTGDQINSTSTNLTVLFGNFSSLSDGTYKLSATANDTFGNTNNSAGNVTLVLDTTSPVLSHSCSPSSVAKGVAVDCTCTATDATTGVLGSTTYEASPSTSISGVYTTTCNAVDYAGNIVSSVLNYTVTAVSGGSSGGGSGGSSSTSWKQTYLNDVQMNSDKDYTKELASKERVRVVLGSEKHYVGVMSLTSNTVTIEVSSTPQTAVMSVGSEKMFDLDSDKSNYDLSVRLVSVVDGKAMLYMKAVNVPLSTKVSEPVNNQVADSVAEDGVNPSDDVGLYPESVGLGVKSKILLVVVILLIIIVLVVVLVKKGHSGNKRR